MQRISVVVVLVLLCTVGALTQAPDAQAEPPAPMEDRVKIFDIEMRRGPARELAPYLTEDAHTLSRTYAVRALGRIGEDDPEAPKMLAELLKATKEGESASTHVLWAAGIAQSKTLTEALLPHARAKAPASRAAALEALGWAKDTKALAALTSGLADTEAAVRVGALHGLARLGQEGVLERVVGFTQDTNADVRKAADLACWMLAGARRRASLASDPKWDGDETLVPWFGSLVDAGEPERRMAALRPLASLLPKVLREQPDHTRILRLVEDEDPRVVQDLVSRILTRREGPLVRATLLKCLAHRDAKVRHLAADAFASREDKDAAEALQKQFGVESDPRMREILAIAMARHADGMGYAALEADETRPQSVPKTFRQLTQLRVALALPDEKGIDDVLKQLALPEGSGLPAVHPIVLMEACGALEDAKHEGVDPWMNALFPRALAGKDPYIASAAIGLAAARGSADLILPFGKESRETTDPEVRSALVQATARLLKDDAIPKRYQELTKKLIGAYLEDENAWVREAARKAGAELKLPDWPERDTEQPNEWKGLPRPTKPVMGLDLHEGQGPWLSTQEILTLADACFEPGVKIRFKTTQGAFTVTADPDAAPAHTAALVLAVHAGTYEATRWHRVVPNFVIQGGDPHGHGAGNDGYTIPDEITRIPYIRGALGMPKSTKDDGGCQLFFMHTAYKPLDERYTCYGNIVSGMDVVDRIRVGDMIVSAEIVRE